MDNNVTGGTGLELPSGFGILTANNGVWGPVITDASANWNAAYGWGDHSTEGYLTQVDTTATNIVDANWKTYIANHSTGASSLWTEDTNGITYAGNIGVGTASGSVYDLSVGSGGISLLGYLNSSGSATFDNVTLNGDLNVSSGYIIASSYIRSPYLRLTEDDFVGSVIENEGNIYNKSNGRVYYQNYATNEFDLTGITQNVSHGSKTASFTHDASLASIGDYSITNSSANTISIHNLEVGMQGTIFVYMGSSTRVFNCKHLFGCGDNRINRSSDRKCHRHSGWQNNKYNLHLHE